MPNDKAGVEWNRHRLFVKSVGKRLAGRQNHCHLTAFHGRHLFNLCLFIHVAFYPQQNIKTQLLVGHFTPPEPQRDFDLVAFVDELVHRPHFHVVVMLFDIRSELDFLDLDDLLFFPRFVLTLLRFILVFAVIENLADRRRGIGRNLDQVEFSRNRAVKRVLYAYDTDIVAGMIDETDFLDVDLLVNARAVLCRRRSKLGSSYCVLLRAIALLFKTVVFLSVQNAG